jgi:DNA polymerase-3 subunit epsilon
MSTIDPRRPVPFFRALATVPIVSIDTETTGTGDGDVPCEIALVRFEGGKVVATVGSRVNPGIPIPAEASAIHGISDDDVRDMPSAATWMATPEVREVLSGAQPLAYNAEFDRRMFPFHGCPDLLSSEWPWLDCMLMLWHLDRYVGGKGRHKLTSACERHGVKLEGAHSAVADATAAGELFYVLAPKVFAEHKPITVGKALELTLACRAAKWADFESWKARQPPPSEAASQ